MDFQARLAVVIDPKSHGQSHPPRCEARGKGDPPEPSPQVTGEVSKGSGSWLTPRGERRGVLVRGSGRPGSAGSREKQDREKDSTGGCRRSVAGRGLAIRNRRKRSGVERGWSGGGAWLRERPGGRRHLDA